MKIKSPAPHYTAKDAYGPLIIEFKDGVAEVDELPAGVRQYLQGAGYGIDTDPEAPEVTEPADPRDVTEEQLGTKLRDAAVDPEEGDFLAPSNAGKANPHGPDVVSPEIHASQGVRPVKGGEAHVGEPAKQDAAETEHAGQESFTVGAPAGNASKETWHAYALTQGYAEEGLEGRTRDELRDLFND
jgi:hypothetical protein